MLCVRVCVCFRALPRVCECASGGCTYTWYTSADGESKYARFSSTLFCHAHALTSSVPFPALLVPVPALSVPFPALLAWLHVPACHAALAVAWPHVWLLHVNSRSVGRLQQKVAQRDSTAATVLLADRPCYMVQRPVRKRCELTALRATVLEDAPYGVRHAPCGMRQRHAPCTAHEQPERRTRALALSGSARPLVASR